MVMELITKTVEVRFIRTEFGDFKASEVANILEELEECDGMFSGLVIYDPKLGKWLESIGAASKNARGSYRGSENLEVVQQEVRNLLRGSI